MMIAEDIERLYEQVEFIKQTHAESKAIEQLIDNRMKVLLSKCEEIDSEAAQKEEEQLKIVIHF